MFFTTHNISSVQLASKKDESSTNYNIGAMCISIKNGNYIINFLFYF